MKRMSNTLRSSENIAGYWNTVYVSPDETFDPQMENNAPISGPKVKPREKATPTRACMENKRGRGGWNVIENIP